MHSLRQIGRLSALISNPLLRYCCIQNSLCHLPINYRHYAKNPPQQQSGPGTLSDDAIYYSRAKKEKRCSVGSWFLSSKLHHPHRRLVVVRPGAYLKGCTSFAGVFFFSGELIFCALQHHKRQLWLGSVAGLALCEVLQQAPPATRT